MRAVTPHGVNMLACKKRGFAVETEMQFLNKEHHLTVCEVPIAVNYDEKPKRNPITHGLQVVNGILRMVGQNRPLFFFATPGTLALIAGLILGYSVVDTYAMYTTLAVGTALIAATLCIIAS